MAKVSIIVPSYNSVPELLTKALLSVKNQTMKDWDLVVVDDGSRDASAVQKIVEAAKIKAKIVRVANGGVAAARQKGLDSTDSSYVMFLDDDDEYHRTICERLTIPLDETRAEFASCGGHEGRTINWKAMTGAGGLVEKSPFSRMSLSMAIFNRCFRRKTIEEHGIRFPIGVRMCDDFVFLNIYVHHSDAWWETKDELYFYRINDKSQRAEVGTELKKFWPDIEKAISFMEDYFTEESRRHGLDERVKIDDDVRVWITNQFLQGKTRFS